MMGGLYPWLSLQSEYNYTERLRDKSEPHNSSSMWPHDMGHSMMDGLYPQLTLQ
jgi:hypothetical protein